MAGSLRDARPYSRWWSGWPMMIAMYTVLFITTMLAFTRAQVQTQEASPKMATPEERAILMEFFDATGGPRWKEKAGWGSESDPCEWHGVLCLPNNEDGEQRWAVFHLSLFDNGLTGAVPPSILQLRRLRGLYLPGNQITSVPREVFTRADANQLQIWLDGNPLPGLLTRIRLRIEHNTGTCFPDQLSRFAADFDGVTRRGRFQAFFCASASGKGEGYCLAGESFVNLDVISRGLRRLGWKLENNRFETPRGGTDHETDVKATLIWGGGEAQTLWIRGGRAPIDILIAQDLIQSLISPEWSATARRGQCTPIDW